MERQLREILKKAGYSIMDSGFGIIDIEIPKDESFGDLSTPIAMSLAKSLKKAPKKIAEDIVDEIKKSLSIQPSEKGDKSGLGIFEKIDIAGPGFINFKFNKTFLCSELNNLIEKNEDFLIEDIGKGKTVQIEFVSANPTGPLHLGHGRGAALGAALSNLLSAAGYKVEREYYINDAGRQVKLLGLSVYARYMQLTGADFPFPEDGYKADYIKDIAQEFMAAHKGNAKDTIEKITDFAYKKMLKEIKNDLLDFGVFFDSWQSEKELYQVRQCDSATEQQKSEVEDSIDELKRKGYIYEKDGAVWFKSTEFGDDKDRVVIKKDGEYTYFASDMAYHRQKVQKGYDEIIDIWGADHHGYIPRIEAVIQALGYTKDNLKILLVQMVNLLRAGKPVQMSKRAGEFITLREVIDEIGADTTKFLFLTRRPDSHLEVDIEVAKSQSHENPVFYVQYAHARINSIFEKAGSLDIANFNFEPFNDEEMRIIKKILLYPMMFKNAALSHEPHRITFYLQELAGMFHTYYQKYRIITDNAELTKARLALCKAIHIVLRHGLKILGVMAPERM